MSDDSKSYPATQIAQSILNLEDDPAFQSKSIEERLKYTEARDRVFALARTVVALSQRSLSPLVSKNGLSQLQNYLQQMLGEVTAFISNGNLGHLNNAAAHVDPAMQNLWAFGPATEVLGTDAIAALFDTKTEEMDHALGRMIEQRDALINRLEDASSETSLLQEKFVALQETIAKERAEAAATVAKLEQQFTKEETSRIRQFQEKIAELENTGLAFHQEAAAETKKILGELESKKSEAETIVQVVGNIGVTGNYQRIANNETAAANLWRWITLAIFAGGITLASMTFWKFWHEPSSTENIWSIAIRLLFAIAITAPALYTAKESARHRTNADRARKLELELASLGPFIELLPQEQKHQIREKLTSVYFGNSEVEPHTPGSLIDPTQLKELLVEVVKVAKK